MGADLCTGRRSEAIDASNIQIGKTFANSIVHRKTQKSDLKRKVKRYRRKLQALEDELKTHKTLIICKRNK